MRTDILIGVLSAAVFAAFAVAKAEAPFSNLVRGGAAAFIFALFCFVVIVSAPRKTTASTSLRQSGLGALAAIAIAAIFQAPFEGYLAAALLGFVLGYVADWWARYIPLP